MGIIVEHRNVPLQNLGDVRDSGRRTRKKDGKKGGGRERGAGSLEFLLGERDVNDASLNMLI